MTQTEPATHPTMGLPHVQGRCPACGWKSLFLGHGGYVTCSISDCPEPDAASTVLERPAGAPPKDAPAAADALTAAANEIATNPTGECSGAIAWAEATIRRRAAHARQTGHTGACRTTSTTDEDTATEHLSDAHTGAQPRCPSCNGPKPNSTYL